MSTIKIRYRYPGEVEYHEREVLDVCLFNAELRYLDPENPDFYTASEQVEYFTIVKKEDG